MQEGVHMGVLLQPMKLTSDRPPVPRLNAWCRRKNETYPPDLSDKIIFPKYLYFQRIENPVHKLLAARQQHMFVVCHSTLSVLLWQLKIPNGGELHQAEQSVQFRFIITYSDHAQRSICGLAVFVQCQTSFTGGVLSLKLNHNMHSLLLSISWAIIEEKWLRTSEHWLVNLFTPHVIPSEQLFKFCAWLFCTKKVG